MGKSGPTDATADGRIPLPTASLLSVIMCKNTKLLRHAA